MTSSLNMFPSSIAAVFRERATRMTTWMAKLELAVELCDTWEALNPTEYFEGSAARAAKAMELVTHTVRILASS